ncbi:hypothetical protein CEXT_748951 [Caerostris extrusa]|uniref:Uncharacterized protein n=1 Tax=Caerostris extrusa TaxID=172846 RepID=A0AAV4QXI2_CAEEX|nr:hypothetical protein CEXT_748951 [Caerostris extrusa]
MLSFLPLLHPIRLDGRLSLTDFLVATEFGMRGVPPPSPHLHLSRNELIEIILTTSNLTKFRRAVQHSVSGHIKLWKQKSSANYTCVKRK